ncbi:MAG: tRNA-guanine transglycosylase, partial [Candidatus Lokiarchaeota archaeon]|nr:tRNA-guanine transglycosylase [Candidatus Lokiarchaeota archaeon]
MRFNITKFGKQRTNRTGKLIISKNLELNTPLLWFGLSIIESPNFQKNVFRSGKIEAFLSNAYDLEYQDVYNKRSRIIHDLQNLFAHKIDSGGFQLMKSSSHINKLKENYTQKKVLQIQSHYNPDIAVQLDYPLFPDLSHEEQSDRIKGTLDNYAYVQSHNSRKFDVMPVVHGYNLMQIRRMVNKVIKHNGDNYPSIIGIGSLVPMVHRMTNTDLLGGKYQFIDNLLFLRHLLPHSLIHAFGIGGTMTYLAVYCGVDSLDSNGWVQKSGYGVIQLPGVSDRFLKKKTHNRPYLIHNRKRRGGKDLLDEIELFMECECSACAPYHKISDKRKAWHKKRKDFDEPGEKGRLLRAKHNVALFQSEILEMRNAINNRGLEAFVEKRLRNGNYLSFFKYIRFFKKLYNA